MRLNEIEYTDSLPIDGYGPGFFRIGGEPRQGPVLVTPSGLIPWQGLDDIAPLTAVAGRVDVLFLGTGAEIAHPPRALREAMEAAQVGLETMSSPAAARTYNVLLSEGRRVAVALIPV
ncbi:hypothetical protein CBW24_03155 [Pacificitalea manganoxidans]|uniref:Mth938-like domain-containing protein n=1 Tax=Pacificitalea manganoxidans TaxID=1411902 RepID=A0A291LX72_9RHOB|nr:Mth938-like domain-containing protein [Pacificitalea manganoxidans]ATI41098.1 hypothetical protein CBW24_03155 [Pacificitalea manganoxidans]MAQ46166.1 hypothetical protein [Actibacterium sp.]MBF51722.1 hypothetical protein [Actibacterium sp.]MDR6308466.1 uncharacterized protein [Pacificitalea manganoxidans]